MASLAAVNQLKRHLKAHLPWHGARLFFLAQFLLALFEVKTVNLAQLATVLSGRAQVASNYKRLQRFFRLFEVQQAQIAPLVVACLPLAPRWHLSLDRTNWRFGRTEINVLMLAVVHQGTAFPLFWTVLDKAGNSNSEERMALMQRFLDTFGAERLEALLADREFIGKVWLQWLDERHIVFRVRLKANLHITNRHGRLFPVRRLFPRAPVGQMTCLPGRRELGGVGVHIAGGWLEGGETLFIATNGDPDTAVSDYSRRWGIECLFGGLKSRGFDFEQTHLTDPERLSRLIALLTLAFAWAHHTGQWLHEQRPIPVKQVKKTVSSNDTPCTRSSAMASTLCARSSASSMNPTTPGDLP